MIDYRDLYETYKVKPFKRCTDCKYYDWSPFSDFKECTKRKKSNKRCKLAISVYPKFTYKKQIFLLNFILNNLNRKITFSAGDLTGIQLDCDDYKRIISGSGDNLTEALVKFLIKYYPYFSKQEIEEIHHILLYEN